MSDVRFGIVGYGIAAQVFHVPVIRAVPGAAVTAIASSKPDAVRAALPGVRVHDAVADLVGDQAVDVVVVTSPNALHYAHARAAIDAGKHVVVEKPFTVTSAEADDLSRRADAAGVTLSVFHNRRWDGDFRTIRQLIADGRLGKVVSFHSRFDRFRPTVPARWRDDPRQAGAGLLYDLGSHLIDQALVLFGIPHTVWADAASRRDGAAVDDDFLIVLGYRERRVVLGAGTLTPEPEPRFVVHGTTATYRKHGLDVQEAQLREGLAPGVPGWAQEAPERFGMLSARYAEGAAPPDLPADPRVEPRVETVPTVPGAYEDFYAAVCDAVRGSGPVPVSGAEGAAVIRIIELAHRSAKQGRRLPVEGSAGQGA